MDTIRKRLEKIAALAASGIGGERETARRMLVELCQRYGMSADELMSDRPEYCDIRYSDKHDEKLVMLVVWFVLKDPGFRVFRKKGSRRCVSFLLTPSDRADVLACLKHYRKLWAAQLDDVFTAFCCKNDIFGDAPDVAAKPDDDPERRRRIRDLRGGIVEDRWKKKLRLGAGAAGRLT